VIRSGSFDRRRRRFPRAGRAPGGRGGWGAATGVLAVSVSEPLCMARSCCQRPKFLDDTSPPSTTAPIDQTRQLRPSAVRRPGESPSSSSHPAPIAAQHVFCTHPETQLPSACRVSTAAAPASLQPLGACANTCVDAQDAQEEECQEGYPVLPDGLRRLRNRCVPRRSPPTRPC
jgi:hypothetical protein